MYEQETTTKRGTRQVVQFYDSLQDFVEVGRKSGKYTDGNLGRHRADFIGRHFDTYVQAEQAAQTVWQDGLDVVDGLVESLMARIATPVKRRRRRKWKQDGDTASIDRILDNRDKVWASHTKINKKAPRSIDVLFEFSAPAFLPWEKVLNRPAVAIAICEVLERAGYGVRLVAMMNSGDMFRGTEGEQVDCIRAITLKEEGTPLDKVAVINAVSGWCYRSLAFRTMSTLAKNTKSYAGGLGRIKSIDNEAASFVVDKPEHAVVITNDFDIPVIEKKAIKRLHEMGIIEEDAA